LKNKNGVPSETTRRLREENILAKIATAYLQGVLGDATYNKIHKTHRISQANRDWLERIKGLLSELGERSWIYKEGRDRNVFVLETASKILSMDFDPYLL
jgi:hypothetical protein